MSSLIINNLPYIEKYSYLELGVRNPEENFLIRNLISYLFYKNRKF